MVMTKLKKAQEYVEEDAPIAHTPMALYAPPLAHHVAPYRPGPPPKRVRLAIAPAGHDAPPLAPPKKNDLSVHDGSKWVKNKNGLELCPWHNCGQCGRTAPGDLLSLWSY